MFVGICVLLWLLTFGKVYVLCNNATDSEYTMWLYDENSKQYEIKANKSCILSHKIMYDDTSLSLFCQNKNGKVERILLSEYVTRHWRGLVYLKIVEDEITGQEKYLIEKNTLH